MNATQDFVAALKRLLPSRRNGLTPAGLKTAAASAGVEVTDLVRRHLDQVIRSDELFGLHREQMAFHFGVTAKDPIEALSKDRIAAASYGGLEEFDLAELLQLGFDMNALWQLHIVHPAAEDSADDHQGDMMPAVSGVEPRAQSPRIPPAFDDPNKTEYVPETKSSHMFWSYAIAAGFLIAALGTAFVLMRGGNSTPPVALASRLTMEFVDASQMQGSKPGDPGALYQIKIALPARTRGDLIFLERWEDGSWVIRPEFEQSWQRIDTADEPGSLTFETVFTSDAEYSKSVFALITDSSVVELLKQLSDENRDSLRQKSDQEFAEFLRNRLQQHGIQLMHSGWLHLPCPSNREPEKK